MKEIFSHSYTYYPMTKVRRGIAEIKVTLVNETPDSDSHEATKLAVEFLENSDKHVFHKSIDGYEVE